MPTLTLIASAAAYLGRLRMLPSLSTLNTFFFSRLESLLFTRIPKFRFQGIAISRIPFYLKWYFDRKKKTKKSENVLPTAANMLPASATKKPLWYNHFIRALLLLIIVDSVTKRIPLCKWETFRYGLHGKKKFTSKKHISRNHIDKYWPKIFSTIELHVVQPCGLQ